MKNVIKLFVVATTFLVLFASCNSSKYASGAQHNRTVNNSHYRGY